MASPNGTYQGIVYDPGAQNAATLTVTGSNTNCITSASMAYYGYTFNVSGTYTTNSLRLQATSTTGGVILNMILNSSDGTYQHLDGTVTVQQGGPNVGKTYNMTLQKNP